MFCNKDCEYLSRKTYGVKIVHQHYLSVVCLFSSVYIASINKLGKITTIPRNSECLKCCTLASQKNKL